jgi:predicted HicB family RNase H-like nuclease
MYLDLVIMAKDKATLNIAPELHRELKIEAAKQGLKISELVQRLLREGLRKAR